MKTFYIGRLGPAKPRPQYRFKNGRVFLSNPRLHERTNNYVPPVDIDEPVAESDVMAIFDGRPWDDRGAWDDARHWTDA